MVLGEIHGIQSAEGSGQVGRLFVLEASWLCVAKRTQNGQWPERPCVSLVTEVKVSIKHNVESCVHHWGYGDGLFSMKGCKLGGVPPTVICSQQSSCMLVSSRTYVGHTKGRMELFVPCLWDNWILYDINGGLALAVDSVLDSLSGQ